jgi:hypothetical protein
MGRSIGFIQNLGTRSQDDPVSLVIESSTSERMARVLTLGAMQQVGGDKQISWLLDDLEASREEAASLKAGLMSSRDSLVLAESALKALIAEKNAFDREAMELRFHRSALSILFLAAVCWCVLVKVGLL